MEKIKFESNWIKDYPKNYMGSLSEDYRIFYDWYSKGEKILIDLAVDTDSNLNFRHYYRELLADARKVFFKFHAENIYKKVTDSYKKYIRIENLLYMISKLYPGLCPTEENIAYDLNQKTCNKIGHEFSQALIIEELLSNYKVGNHILKSMRVPLVESFKKFDEFIKNNEVQLGKIKLFKKDKFAYLVLSNKESLNAEDEDFVLAMEMAVDLILLDPDIFTGVIRGDFMEHNKYKNKRVFCSGVNLNKLYEGKLSYMFYISRELGLMSKIYRGIIKPSTDKRFESVVEKPWVSVVDTHAIGGGCQIMLVSDYVIAEKDAYFTIPARTEGFIPGLANLRLPHYVGKRLANRMIYQNHKVNASSDVGKMLVDEVVDLSHMDLAIESVVNDVVKYGLQSTVCNRKAFRCSFEPIEVFREYMVMFCREQAKCMYSNELTSNLEKFWINRHLSKKCI